jgi:hypothetical protein
MPSIGRRELLSVQHPSDVNILNVAIFWVIAPCSSHVNRSSGGKYHFHLQGRKSVEQETSVQHVTRQNSDFRP